LRHDYTAPANPVPLPDSPFKGESGRGKRVKGYEDQARKEKE